MTLPAKNRSRVRLASGYFRYIFKANKDINTGRLMVEEDNGLGPKLIVNWFGLLPDKPNVVPKRHLATAIEFGIRMGWKTTEASQFEIGCDATRDPILLVKRPENVSNDWFQSWIVDEHEAASKDDASKQD